MSDTRESAEGFISIVELSSHMNVVTGQCKENAQSQSVDEQGHAAHSHFLCLAPDGTSNTSRFASNSTYLHRECSCLLTVSFGQAERIIEDTYDVITGARALEQFIRSCHESSHVIL
jgi:hypothetical protein